MASYTIIDQTEQSLYEQAYQSYVNANPDLISAFTVGSDHLFGFKISKVDYETMISPIGITNWKFRFGYKNSNFVITIQGVGPNGQNPTPIYLLDVELIDAVSSLSNSKNTRAQIVLPNDIAYIWAKSWSNLMEADQAPQSFFLTSTDVLMGYNFSMNDLTSVLIHSTVTTTNINVILINHSVPVDPISQPQSPGYLGLMLGAQDASGEYSTHFYDLSAPCPPTCL